MCSSIIKQVNIPTSEQRPLSPNPSATKSTTNTLASHSSPQISDIIVLNTPSNNRIFDFSSSTATGSSRVAAHWADITPIASFCHLETPPIPSYGTFISFEYLAKTEDRFPIVGQTTEDGSGIQIGMVGSSGSGTVGHHKQEGAAINSTDATFGETAERITVPLLPKYVLTYGPQDLGPGPSVSDGGEDSHITKRLLGVILMLIISRIPVCAIYAISGRG